MTLLYGRTVAYEHQTQPSRRYVVFKLCLLVLSTLLSACEGGKTLVIPLRRKPGSFRGRSLLRNSSYPLHGTVKDLGYFYATLLLGTPPRPFSVIVDTGSTITYVPCASCGNSCGTHKDPPFDPFQSQTYKAIGCHDANCVCGNPRCSCHQDQCFYSRHYAEQSSSQGWLIEDVLHFHDGSGAVPFVFGCETGETGEIFRQEADGIMGLGNSEASVINQLVKGQSIDDVFSLCFGSIEGDGLLLLGDVAFPPSVSLQYTDLIHTIAHYYIVKLDSLVLGDHHLDVRQGLYDIGYGVVLDSGTTFTYLPTEAYEGFRDGVDKAAKAKGLKRVAGPDPRFAGSDICWSGAAPIEEAHKLHEYFPELGLDFKGGTKLRLSPLNYLFMHTRQSGAYCLGVFDNSHQGTLLGGITFRNVLIQYDRRNQRVGFAYAPCQRLGRDLAPPCDVIEGIGGEAAAERAARAADCRTLPEPQPPATDATHATPVTPSSASQSQSDPAEAAWQFEDVESQPVQDVTRPGDEDAFLKSEEDDDMGSSSLLLWLTVATALLLIVGLLALVGTCRRNHIARHRGFSTAGTREVEVEYAELASVDTIRDPLDYLNIYIPTSNPPAPAGPFHGLGSQSGATVTSEQDPAPPVLEPLASGMVSVALDDTVEDEVNPELRDESAEADSSSRGPLGALPSDPPLIELDLDSPSAPTPQQQVGYP